MSHIDHIGPLDGADADAFRLLASRSFPLPMDGLTRLLEVVGRENQLAVKVDGRLAGGLGVIRTSQWFGGRSVSAAGISHVAVAPEYRGMGVGRRLMTSTLEKLHVEGVPLAVLYPATIDFYRAAGFERAGTRTAFESAIPGIRRAGASVSDGLRPARSALPIAEQESCMSEAIRLLHADRCRCSNGLLDRVPLMYEFITDKPPSKPTASYVIEGASGPEGFVTLAQFGRTVKILDWHTSTLPATRRLCDFLAGYGPLMDRLVWIGSLGNPLSLLLDQEVKTVAGVDQWALRLIDVELALTMRGYNPNVTGDLHLDVRDETFAWNNRRIVLEIGGGAAQVRAGGSGALSIDVRGLAPLYTGHLAPWELRAVGNVDATDETMAFAAAVFSGPAPWMPDHF